MTDVFIELNVVTVVTTIVAAVLYTLFQLPKYRKRAKMGLLLTSYIRDITGLLEQRFSEDWHTYDMPYKLEMLKALYDLIANYTELSNSVLKQFDGHDKLDIE